jgi:CheY-like chemotaxis protein
MTNEKSTEPGTCATILIVDDDRVIHSIITRALPHRTLLHAYDGEEGLRIARDARPQLILTDALLPRKDGRELALAVKQGEDTAHIKVVVMTALYKGIRYRNEAIRDFMVDDYVEKPLSATMLRQLVEKFCGPVGPAGPDLADSTTVGLTE